MTHPRYPKVEKCAWLFRKGGKVCEDSFLPDMDLVHEMMDRKLRVQDLLDYVVATHPREEEVTNFLDWYKLRHSSSSTPASSA